MKDYILSGILFFFVLTRMSIWSLIIIYWMKDFILLGIIFFFYFVIRSKLKYIIIILLIVVIFTLFL